MLRTFLSLNEHAFECKMQRLETVPGVPCARRGIFRAARRITSNVPNENSRADAGQISTERAPALDVRRISDLRPTRPKREPPLALVYASSFFFSLFSFPFSFSFSGFMEASGRRSRTHVVVGLRLRLSRVLNGSTLLVGSVLARMSR